MLDFKKIYKNLRGKIPCKEGCTICCQEAGDIVLFPEESKLLIEKVSEAKKYIYNKKIKGQTIDLIKQPCPFLKNNLCSIEKNRPIDCRFYPFDYCIFNNKIIIFTSKSCPIEKDIPENEVKKISKNILNILHRVPREWLKSAILFGPCGNCNKINCKLKLEKGINDKDW